VRRGEQRERDEGGDADRVIGRGDPVARHAALARPLPTR
jgi:hypothetical protein